ALERDLGAAATGSRQLARRAGDAARAEVLQAARDAALAHDAQRLVRGHVQDAFQERIRQLHRAAAILAAQLDRRERRATEAAVVGRLADQHERPWTGAFRDPAADDTVRGREPRGHDVDEAGVVEAGVVDRVATQVRHPERVAVGRDALDHAAHDVARV